MKTSKSLLNFGFAVACVAITFSLAVRAQAQTVTFLAEFSSAQGSATSVVQATDGNFYGTDGGNLGQIFRMTPSGELSTVYNFCSQPGCDKGLFLNSGPILGSDGNLYGVTSSGGNSSESGTFYKSTLGGDLTTLYTFCPSSGCADGISPNGVILASDGNFYGTTYVGGASSYGTIFRISPAGEFKLLHTFCSRANCVDGAQPRFPPIQAGNGNFYGTAYWGGTLGGGVFYELTPSGAYSVLFNFCGYSDSACDNGNQTGSGPSTVVQDAKGNFFGTTVFGGGNIDNYGTIFEITSTNQYHVLHRFDINHGDNPVYGLTLANDGNFYGAGTDDGYNGEGTLFEITPAGVYTPLFTFECCNEGYDPFYGPLFQGTDGSIYGTTLYGSGACCYGTIFALSNNLSPLVETVPVAGPVGKRVLILGNGLTGSTSVTFNGVEAAFTVESDTYIKATVPTGAKTGVVSVVTPSGTLKSNPQFVVSK